MFLIRRQKRTEKTCRRGTGRDGTGRDGTGATSAHETGGGTVKNTSGTGPPPCGFNWRWNRRKVWGFIPVLRRNVFFSITRSRKVQLTFSSLITYLTFFGNSITELMSKSHDSIVRIFGFISLGVINWVVNWLTYQFDHLDNKTRKWLSNLHLPSEDEKNTWKPCYEEPTVDSSLDLRRWKEYLGRLNVRINHDTIRSW